MQDSLYLAILHHGTHRIFYLPSIEQPLSILVELHVREESIGNRLTEPHSTPVPNHWIAIDACAIKGREADAHHRNSRINRDVTALGMT